MFRPIVWLHSAAFLILVGAYPPLATFTGSLLLAAFGLGVQGAVLLLAQTAVQIALFAAAAVWAVRSWRTA